MKIFLLLLTTITFLLADSSSFEQCKAKIKDAGVIKQDTLYIPLENSKALLYSKTLPKTKIYKQDTKNNLYIVDDTSNFKYPFKLNRSSTNLFASVDENMAMIGNFFKEKDTQVGFSACVSEPSLILTPCCAIEGLITHSGVITKETIEKFLVATPEAPKKVTQTTKNPKNDISNANQEGLNIQGLVFNQKLEVISIEPSAKKYGLKLGDRLLKMGNSYVQNYKEATLLAKSLKKGETILVQRENFQFFVKLN
ncbi:MAG: hypothetical protein WC144_00355 [Sulfurimonas sp.]